MLSQVSRPVRIAAAAILLNWVAWTVYCAAIGGDALGSEITADGYFIRRNPASPLYPVSRPFWLFSLVYSFITFGVSIPALALLFVFHRPSWDRGILGAVAILASAAWLLTLTPRFVQGLTAWLAA